VAGGSITSADYIRREEELGWIGAPVEAVDEDISIQAEVVAVHSDELAARARLAVPGEVADAWVARGRIARNGTELPVLTDEGQVDPANAFRHGPQWLFRVRCGRHLFGQSGYPNQNAVAVVKWPLTGPVTLTVLGTWSS
jgi:hypothetical protein